MKINAAIITVKIEAVRTAPAAKSFAFPAKGCSSGEIKSTTFSMALFIISAAKTSAKHSKIIHHSVGDIFEYIPKIVTKNTAKR